MEPAPSCDKEAAVTDADDHRQGDAWSPARIRVNSVGLDTRLKGDDMARRADQDMTRLH
jgi:hypothetical protein